MSEQLKELVILWIMMVVSVLTVVMLIRLLAKARSRREKVDAIVKALIIFIMIGITKIVFM